MEENLREELKNYVQKTGIKYTYICTKINIHTSTLSHFVNADRRVSKKTLDKIKNYLLKENV